MNFCYELPFIYNLIYQIEYFCYMIIKSRESLIKLIYWNFLKVLYISLWKKQNFIN
jgi:hypothetical protein